MTDTTACNCEVKAALSDALRGAPRAPCPQHPADAASPLALNDDAGLAAAVLGAVTRKDNRS